MKTAVRQGYSFLLQGEKFELNPLKALFWPRRKTLIISDVHLGKDAYFRKNGIPIPQTSNYDLLHMQQLFDYYAPREVIFLGDLFHSVQRETFDEFLSLLAAFPSVNFIYLAGNHDARPPLSTHRLEFMPEYVLDGFLFVHDFPQNETHKYVIQGHVHPKISIRLAPSGRKSFPCMAIYENKAILPAFGTFTGGFRIDNEASLNRVILLTPSKCFEMQKPSR